MYNPHCYPGERLALAVQNIILSKDITLSNPLKVKALSQRITNSGPYAIGYVYLISKVT